MIDQSRAAKCLKTDAACQWSKYDISRYFYVPEVKIELAYRDQEGGLYLLPKNIFTVTHMFASSSNKELHYY